MPTQAMPLQLQYNREGGPTMVHHLCCGAGVRGRDIPGQFAARCVEQNPRTAGQVTAGR